MSEGSVRKARRFYDSTIFFRTTTLQKERGKGGREEVQEDSVLDLISRQMIFSFCHDGEKTFFPSFTVLVYIEDTTVLRARKCQD